MWPHRLQPIPHGGRAAFLACVLSAIVAALLPELTPRERLSAALLVPVSFFAAYVLARLTLPLLGGTAKVGTWVATALFYVVPLASALEFCLASFGLGSEALRTPGYRAYGVATSLPVGMGFAAAALHRIRTNAVLPNNRMQRAREP